MTTQAIDIVRRLRDRPCVALTRKPCPRPDCECITAADEIEKLRKALEQIERIASEPGDSESHKGKLVRIAELAHGVLW